MYQCKNDDTYLYNELVALWKAMRFYCVKWSIVTEKDVKHNMDKHDMLRCSIIPRMGNGV